jgi:hypothetical protein
VLSSLKGEQRRGLNGLCGNKGGYAIDMVRGKGASETGRAEMQEGTDVRERLE